MKCHDCGHEMTGQEVNRTWLLAWIFGLYHFFVRVCDDCKKKREKPHNVIIIVFLLLMGSLIAWYLITAK